MSYDAFTAIALEEIGIPHAMTELRDTVGVAIRWSAWLRRRTASPVADELELDDRDANWSEVELVAARVRDAHWASRRRRCRR